VSTALLLIDLEHEYFTEPSWSVGEDGAGAQ
jgi:hypothetical protein